MCAVPLGDLEELAGEAADFDAAGEDDVFGGGLGHAGDLADELVGRHQLNTVLPGVPDLPHALQLALRLLLEQVQERGRVRQPERLRLQVALAHLFYVRARVR